MKTEAMLSAALLALLPIGSSATANDTNPRILAGQGYSYADLADLSLAAPAVAVATVTQATRLKGADAQTVPAGRGRLFVRAHVTALLKGAGGLATDVSYLVDLPLDSANHPPKLRKLPVLLFASADPAGTGTGDAGALRLVAPDAQLGWTPDLEARVRAVLQAAADPQAPPRVTGIGNAFHVPGTLPGESETQIFLTTADGRPVSLAVLRRPDEQPRWAVALAEMVDEAAAPPPPNSLLWYRLACGLPATLPAASLASGSADDAAAARADYEVVLAGLGPCARTRTQD